MLPPAFILLTASSGDLKQLIFIANSSIDMPGSIVRVVFKLETNVDSISASFINANASRSPKNSAFVDLIADFKPSS